MKDEIRQAVRLSEELEDQTFDMQGEAFKLLAERKSEEAVAKIKQAWDLVPEPKFNTSCSYTILCDLVEILTITGKHVESEEILENWIHDLETCGYKIYETTPYILFADTLLHLDKSDNAKEQFYAAIKYGATTREFGDFPSSYFKIAKKKIMDTKEIKKLFAKELSAKQSYKTEVEELSDEACDQIEELSERGNVYFEAGDYTEAIKMWQQALSKIPSPQNTFSESLWLELQLEMPIFHLEIIKKH